MKYINILLLKYFAIKSKIISSLKFLLLSSEKFMNTFDLLFDQMHNVC